MGVTALDRNFRHIVDVDGLLLGIEQAVVDAGQLLRRAGLPEGRRLTRLVGDRSIVLPAGHAIQLSEDDVPFFRSVPATAALAEAIAA